MAAPSEHCRNQLDDNDDDDHSAKMYDLEALFTETKKQLPYGSTALLRVVPGENQGQDIVPVLVARKAPCPWSLDLTSADGMFVDGDTVLWVVDLEMLPLEASSESSEVKYIVPHEILPTHKMRAVPLKCIAGLGQGLGGYMDEVAVQESSKHFVLRAGVVEDARSNLVLMSTKPSSAFEGFVPVAFSEEDIARSPLRPKLFDIGTVVKRKFSGPLSGEGKKRVWRTKRTLEAEVIGIQTDRANRRHRYKLRWKGDEETIKGAGGKTKVDEGYVEQYER